MGFTIRNKKNDGEAKTEQSRFKVKLFKPEGIFPVPSLKLRPGGCLMIVILCIAAFLFFFSTTYIRPYEWGIKQVKLGPWKGIRGEIYETGLHILIPGIETIHRFPRSYQLLEMNANREEVIGAQRVLDPIRIQTREGYNVEVDISIVYRIADPHKVMMIIGPGKQYEDNFVIQWSERVLRKVLGGLDANEFYNEGKRIEKTLEAQKELNQDLTKMGIEIKFVLMRQYRYAKEYQTTIEQRKIQDQTVFKNQAESLAAFEEANKNKIVAEGIAAVNTERVRGEAEVKMIHAVAELYKRKRAAEGDLLVKTAEAEGTSLENDALKGAGSEMMVGLEMAKILEGAKRIVIPVDGATGINPLDLDTLLKKFDVKEGGGN